MRSDEEAIKTLKMRMRHQVSPALEKDLVRQNIQYYVSSAMMQKEGERREEELGEKFHPHQAADGIRGEHGKLPAEKKSQLSMEEKEALLTKEGKSTPMDFEQIQKAGESSLMTRYTENAKAPEMPEMPEAMEMQQLRGKGEYEKIRHSMEFGGVPDESGFYYLNEKG